MNDKEFTQEIGGIKAFVEDYLLTRCRLKGKLEEDLHVLDGYFANMPYVQKQLRRHKLELDTYVEQCRLYRNEYLIDTYKYHVEFQEIEIHNEVACVALTTNEVKKFRCTNEMTMVKDIPHYMILQKQKGKWFVVEHQVILEFVGALEYYGDILGIKDMEEVQEIYLREADERREKMEPYSIKKKEIEVRYDRKKAVDYAIAHVLETDEEIEGDRDEGEKFVVECIEQGGGSWNGYHREGTESELRLGDVVKIPSLTEGIHSMIVTGYIYYLFNHYKVVGYLVSRKDLNERHVPLATKPYPREYILIEE